MVLRQILVGALAVTLVGQAQSPTKVMPENVVIFAVRADGQSLSVDPIVTVHFGGDQRYKSVPALNPPVPVDWAEEEITKFDEAHYASGTQIAGFRGGEAVGIVTVSGATPNTGCLDLSASVSYNGTTRPFLAASSLVEIPGRRSTRRTSTPPETAILAALARQWFIEYGLDRPLVQTGTIGPVVSARLRSDGGRALIGRFDVASKLAIHQLFAVAEQVGGRYEITLAELTVQRDLEDGTDKNEREYLDQLDINNDGQDELVTMESQYEGWSYTVWTLDKRNKLWRKAYTGGGGGC
jgi:hypothetical protein